jgi:hypothetical protein
MDVEIMILEYLNAESVLKTGYEMDRKETLMYATKSYILKML